MPDATNGTNATAGKIVEIKGVVIDVVFAGELPEIYSSPVQLLNVFKDGRYELLILSRASFFQ